MKVTAEFLPARQVLLTIEAEPPEMERSLDRAYRRIVQKASIPGFRKGKAPRTIIEKFFGKKYLLEEAAELMVPELTDQAIKEQGLEIAARPSIEVTAVEPVAFKATVPLRPLVNLNQYKTVRVVKEPVEVTQEQIDSVIEQLRFNAAPWSPAERPVKLGDLATMDIEGYENQKEVLRQTGIAFRPLKDLPNPVPGFSEQLEGVAIGQSKEFVLTFLPENPNKDVAGKTFRFKVTVHEVKEKQLPALDDAFVKSLGEGLETVDQLKERVAKNLTAAAESSTKDRYEQQVLDAIAKQATLEYPPVLVEHEIDHMLDDQMRQLQRSKVTFEEYLKSIGKTAEQLREELKPAGTQRLVNSLILGKVVEEEQINALPEEVDSEVDRLSQGSGEQAERVRQLFASPSAKVSIERTLLTRKALERLCSIASEVGGPTGDTAQAPTA